MANDKQDAHTFQSKTKKRRKSVRVPPINHWHSTFVVVTAGIIFMVGTGMYTTAGAGLLAAYGTSNWLRYDRIITCLLYLFVSWSITTQITPRTYSKATSRFTLSFLSASPSSSSVMPSSSHTYPNCTFMPNAKLYRLVNVHKDNTQRTVRSLKHLQPKARATTYPIHVTNKVIQRWECKECVFILTLFAENLLLLYGLQ